MAKNIFETLVGAVVLVIAVGFTVFMSFNGKADTPDGIQILAKFDRVDGLSVGSDVRLSGLKVGTVSAMALDPKNYIAIVTMGLEESVSIPDDSSAEIVGDGLLGAKYVAIVPGGSETMLKNKEEIALTQSAVSIEALIGKFMFGGAKDDKEGGKEGAQNAPSTSGAGETATPPAGNTPKKDPEDVF